MEEKESAEHKQEKTRKFLVKRKKSRDSIKTSSSTIADDEDIVWTKETTHEYQLPLETTQVEYKDGEKVTHYYTELKQNDNAKEKKKLRYVVTPQMKHALKMSQMQSQLDYQRDMKKVLGRYHLDECLTRLPEVETAKRAALLLSKMEYQQQQKLNESYRGFQTMDSKDHPVVQQGIKAAQLVDSKAYTEDWESEKDCIYYPVHITPGYESASNVKPFQSDFSYKSDFEKKKDQNEFDLTATERYKQIKESDKTISDVKYKEDYEKKKGKDFTNIPETHEMIQSKNLQPIVSKKAYSEKSKKMMKDVNITADVQDVAHAVASQKLGSSNEYKMEYMKEVYGKPPMDPSNSYPEHAHHKKVSKLLSQAEYHKDAEKSLHCNQLPVEYTEFVRAKESAKKASDIEYRKQKKETIDQYRGFQTMDSKQHPVVQQGIKAAELMSDKLYKDEWESDKGLIYYPVHITQGYEQALEASKLRSDAAYTKEGRSANMHNQYRPNETLQYEAAKNLLQTVSDNNYKAGYLSQRSSFHPAVSQTAEMILSKSMKPFLSNKAYTRDATNVMQKYNLDTSYIPIERALQSQKLSSAREYLEDFKKNVVGKAPSDLEMSYPEYKFATKVASLNSKNKYTKDAEKALHQHNLPLDYPEFLRAKENAKNISDMEYHKENKKTNESYRGFQTMDSKDHPVVQQGIKAAQLVDSKAYTEDWESEKDCIYYPVHITPGYESASNVKPYQSDMSYKGDFEKDKDKNRFDLTATERYKQMKEADKTMSDVKYKEDYEKKKGKDFTNISETHEMIQSKNLQPIVSKKAYSEKSKKMMKDVNITADVQDVAHAVASQKLGSSNEYKMEYMKEVYGKPPMDPSNSYPEHAHHKKVSKLLSQAEYHKDAEKSLHCNQLPVEYTEFVRAKESAKKASDIEYRKQKKETIDQYRGFQTMDSKQHPVVQQGIKAAELMSDKLYKDEWESDKGLIYYPVHITQGYEQALEASKLRSDAAYTKEGRSANMHNQYRPNETLQYEAAKNLLQTVSDINYKAGYLSQRSSFHPAVSQTAEMILSKSMKPFLSNKAYTRDATNVMQKYNLDTSYIPIERALQSQKLSSAREYLEDFKKNVVGKAPSDLEMSYPEYKFATKVASLNSKNKYTKDAEKALHQHNLPLDYPEFLRAKENAKNISDMEYHKENKKLNESYRGFQTMDSKDHPVVQQGIKAAQLVDSKAYTEDWESEKDCIYYPVHITPGYESASNVKPFQSDMSYKSDFEKDKEKNRFDLTATERYKQMKEADKTVSDIKYKEDYEKKKGKDFTNIPETHEMIQSKTLQPIVSKKAYSEKSKKMMKDVNITADVQDVAHAVASQKLGSSNEYKMEYMKEVYGKPPMDPSNSYPEHAHHKKVSKLLSQAEYHKDAEKSLHCNQLPVEYTEFVRAKESAKKASDIEYRKQKKETIDQYRGFQTMDSKEHPVVQQGIKAAELMSDKLYKDEWESDKGLIYYPVHITQGYEQALEASRLRSDAAYTKEGRSANMHNQYRPNETLQYEATKNLLQTVSDINYKAGYLSQRSSFHPAVSQTAEMILSKSMKPFLSNEAYTRDATNVMQKYNLDTSYIPIERALQSQKLSSAREYLEDFKKNVVGKAPSDLEMSYPEYKFATKVASLNSKNKYTKDAEKALHQHNLPLDYPEFLRAKENAKNISDMEYHKENKKLNESYRGFQTMDSKDHPVVQQGIKAAKLVDSKAYTEDWESEKDCIYYPVHITPGYESASNVRPFQSDMSYKSDFEKDKDKNRFDLTATERYRQMKEADKTVSDIKYKEDYEKKKGTNFTNIPETHEMIQSKNLQPIVSKKAYSEKSKKMMKDVNMTADVQDVAHAVASQKLGSSNEYKMEYMKEVYGKPPMDPPNSYPEHAHHKKVSKHLSQAEYHKDAEKSLHCNQLPVEYTEFVRAKESAKNASDIEYRKQKKETIDQYRGFQTMDSKQHPVVQQGIKAAELMSDKLYKDEWESDKGLIYYPVHITQGYEQALEASKLRSDAAYTKEGRSANMHNQYRPNETLQYEAAKNLLQTVSDINYKAGYLSQRSSFHPAVSQTAEMILSKSMKPFLSNKAYTRDATNVMQKYNLDTSYIPIERALQSQKLSSAREYLEDFKKNVVGKAPSDLEMSYPEYKFATKVTSLNSKNNYVKDAEKILRQPNLPADYPEFARAKENAKNISDIEYRKQQEEVIQKYRGFQTMDSKQHPVVQQGLKVAELLSEHNYIADYLVDRSLIYYPVHLTANYEAAIKANQHQSQIHYKAGYAKSKNQNKYNPTDTDFYKESKDRVQNMSEQEYRRAGKKLLGTSFAPAEKTNEMVMAEQLSPLKRHQYQKQAKDLMNKYHLTVELPEITHAAIISNMVSRNKYLEEYNKEIKGSAPSDLANSYPEYIHAKRASKIASKVEYTKDGNRVRHVCTLPGDAVELEHAKKSTKDSSNIRYKKQKKETIDQYRGFQTMDSKEHPVVQQGIKAAELMSDRKYKEEYMEDRNLIYFPVHLTPGYDVAIKSSQNLNDALYKAQYKSEKEKNQYNVVNSGLYEKAKELQQTEKYYKSDLKLLPTLLTSVDDSLFMRFVKSLDSASSNKLYTMKAKKSLDKYSLSANDTQIAHALLATSLTSDNAYRHSYEEELKGKGASGSGIENYPDYVQAKTNKKNWSKKEYQKENEKIIHHYTMPVDTPEMKRVKESSVNASDLCYTKQQKKVIEQYRGFQTMGSKDHPVVKQGIKVAELLSERKYKEEYMMDKGLIYYPVHLTPGYEVALKSVKFASDAEYKQWYNKNILGSGYYPFDISPGYNQAKQLQHFINAKLYKEKYEKTKSNFSSTSNMNEERCINIVQPQLSKKLYAKEALDIMGKYHLDAEVPEIAHALLITNLLSKNEYKKKYESSVKGQGAKMLEQSPFFKQQLAATQLASKVDYCKKAEENLRSHSLGVDATEIQQAIASNKLTSKIKYNESKEKTLKSMQAYYKLNCDDLPFYGKQKKFASAFSDVKYKEDYNDMKKYVYFPYHITPHYEKAVTAAKRLSMQLYQKEYNQGKTKTNYKCHEDALYIANKQLQELLNEPKMKKALKELHMHGFTLSESDFSMQHIKEIQKQLSSNDYKAASKEDMNNYSITPELLSIQQAILANERVNNNLYQKDLKKVKGHSMTYNPEIPMFVHARNVKALTSDKSYKDDAAQSLHNYQVVPETPDIAHAKAASNNASQVKYKEKGKEENANVRGYQFLNAKEQRDVVHACKVNNIISPAKYKEEYNELRNIIYFPVHLTEGYETALKATAYASPSMYKRDWMKNMHKNSFKVNETEGYMLEQAIQQTISDICYRAAYNKSLGSCPYVVETPQLEHQRKMKVLHNDRLYKADAHSIMDKYHLIVDEPHIVLAAQALKQLSDNIYKDEYMHEKSKNQFNFKDTPLMVQLKKARKLASDISYKQQALSDLQTCIFPEDAVSIKHAKAAGGINSDLMYKKMGKKNLLEGYKKLSFTENPSLQHHSKLKDIQSENTYKRDLYEQRGQSIPVMDTIDNVRCQKQQILQSNNQYQKDLEKHIKGHGLSTNNTPQLQHAKEILAAQKKEKEPDKGLHIWKSEEAINTPDALKAREMMILYNEKKYKEEYEQSKGQGCNVITPAIAAAKNISKVVSDNVYKEKFQQDLQTPSAFSLLPTTPFIAHVQQVGAKISKIKYKEEHEKEDLGHSSELKDAVQIKQDKLTTALQSKIEYKKQGLKDVAPYTGYFRCLNESPQMLHARKVKEALSDYKYKEDFEREKGIYFYPYELTPLYEAQVQAGKLINQKSYKKKAMEGHDLFHFTTDEAVMKQVLIATQLLSDVKYRQPYQGIPANLKSVRDIPLVLHSKRMQDYLSDKIYKGDYEEMKSKSHLLPSALSLIHARNATRLISEDAYKKGYKMSKGQPYSSFKDSLLMNHLRQLFKKMNDIKYKEDLIASKGKALQVTDTPWQVSFKNAQKFISEVLKLGKGYRKLKCLYQPDKFNKHVKNVTDSISENNYHESYLMYYKGNLIPLPSTLETELVRKNSRLFSKAAYKQKAKEFLQHYLINPDDLEFRRHKDADHYLSSKRYKEKAVNEFSHFTSPLETPALCTALKIKEIQSENAYKKKSKKQLATDFKLPPEGTVTMQQQKSASALASENTYKVKGDQVKHDPSAYKHMKEIGETLHAKKIAPDLSEVQYKATAKKNLSRIHPVTKDLGMKAALETSKNISDIDYKAKDKEMYHNYKLGEKDNFISHALKVGDIISSVKYKADYVNDMGLCWCLPDEKVFQHARKVFSLFSDNEYKHEAKKMKGKFHVTTDTPEFERLRNAQQKMSENLYKKEATAKRKDFTILDMTPEIKHATDVSTIVSKVKYQDKSAKNLQQFTVLEKDPKIDHAKQCSDIVSKSGYTKKHKEIQKKGYTFIANRPDTEQQKKAQKIASNIEYKRNAKEKIGKDFTVLESRPDMEHATNIGKIQSDVLYKQSLEGKSIDNMDTPLMKHAIDVNKMQSQRRYRKTFDDEIKGKGWKITDDIPSQKHIQEMEKIQSQYKYTKKHRDNIGKGYTSVSDRPDILHAASCSDKISDYEYKRRHKDMAGTGYTFVPDTPGQLHAEEAGRAQSELQYRRKYSNKGKSWQVEESPAMDHQLASQKLVGNINYKKDALENNSRGIIASMDYFSTSSNKKPQEILKDSCYKADFESKIKGHGMTFDLHGTPAMNHVKKAESIKSDVKYKQNQCASVGLSNYFETPEMIRVRANQAAISQVQYRADAEKLKGRQATTVIDTPELRLARQNKENFSNVKYQQDRHNLRGKVTQLAENFNTRHVKQATHNASDVTYKGVKGRGYQVESNHIQQLDNRVSSVGGAVLSSPDVVKCEQVKRWRRNPHSIFDYNPCDYASESEYENGKLRADGKGSSLSTRMDYQTTPDVFESNQLNKNNKFQFTNFNSKSTRQGSNTWTNYKIESGYRPINLQSNFNANETDPYQKQYQALFDFSAAEDDEVTLLAGDIVTNAQYIDEGWMFGTCRRTGKTGMLPSNYVQLVS